jgi:hypothetical protein
MGLVRLADEQTEERGDDALPAHAAHLVRHAELAVLAFTVVLAFVEVAVLPCCTARAMW